MIPLLPLAQTHNLSLPEVGYQGQALSHLAQAGHPVLPGYILPGKVLGQFLGGIQWQVPLLRSFPQLNLHLDVNQADQLQHITHLIQAGMAQTPVPLDWSQSWLQQCGHAPYLRLLPSLWVPQQASRNLGLLEGLLMPQFCRAEAAALGEALKALWCQLFEAKALFYWQQSGLRVEEVHLAVVVQPVSTISASGFLQMTPTHGLIQATYGLSHSLYEGYCIPDYYAVHQLTGQTEQQLGVKSYAYYLRASQPAAATSPPEVLKGVGIDMVRQQQFALSPEAVKALMHIGQQLTPSWQTAVLEWMLLKTPAHAPEFVLSRVFEQHPIPYHSPAQTQSPAASESADRILAEGVAAASGRAIATTWVTHDLNQHPPPSESRPLLVIPELHPEHVPWLQQAAGLVCERGGMTSHGAIVARELGLPAVVGVPQATQRLRTGQTLLIDGEQGRLYEVDAHQPQPATPEIQLEHPQTPAETPAAAAALRTQIWVNLSQPRALERVQHLPVDGVGLLRSEWLLLEALEQQHPAQWLQQGQQAELIHRFSQRLEPFARAFYPRPVWYRALDLRSPDLATLTGGIHRERPEVNPMLGLRGVARSLENLSLFSLELAALAALINQGLDNLRLLLPFVRSVHEFQACRQRLQQAGLLELPQFQVWIMAEVPSVLFLLPDYVAAGVQGIAIGTNDLTQLLLGIDRDQPTLAPQFNERHPAVVAAVNQLISTARALDLPCSVCGQAPSRYPDLIQDYVNSGVTALSVEIDAVMQTRAWVAQVEGQNLAITGKGEWLAESMSEPRSD